MTTYAPHDPHFKKTVALRLAGRLLELEVAQELFSSHEVDAGTRLLLRTLATEEHRALRRVLDLGCGYGPVGLGLKALRPDREVHMVDRDALAVEFSRHNAARNGFADVRAYGSLGYGDVRGAGFDLVACNLPAKAGTPVIERLLLGAGERLRPGGLVAVVVVARLEATVAGMLEDPGVRVVHRRRTGSYAVFHYHLAAGRRDRERPPGQGSPYDRGTVRLAFGEVTAGTRTAYGLPEFDSLGYASQLVAEALLRQRGRPARAALAFNPGQGHLPALLWRALRPGGIRVVDRDLLALRFTQANLVGNGCPAERIALHHRAGLAGAGEGEGPVDLAVGVLRAKQPPGVAAEAVRQLAGALAPGGRLLLGASSTAVTRCLDALAAGGARPQLVERRRRKGFSAVVLERPPA
ncbi:MAG TPA: methyltransferase [Actinomycetes bacterium]|jgi:16S rRNA G1207 methylase RsmC|nr:methyltransferase [Actinomycetes bacterium]